MEHIWDFIHTVDVNDIREVLERQKTYNMAIAREGMRGQYGSNIGALLLDMNGMMSVHGREHGGSRIRRTNERM